MKELSGILLAGFLLLIPVACAPSDPLSQGAVSQEREDAGHPLELFQQWSVLAFVNDQSVTTVEVLDEHCRIRKDSAANIIDHRDGQDGLPDTDDDDLFDGLEELEAVEMVGPWTLVRIYECATLGNLSLGDVSGLLAFVNDQEKTSFERLDVGCAIRSDSAARIIMHRDGLDTQPRTRDDDLFDTLDELYEIHMVGTWTVERLYTCAHGYGYL